MDISPQTVRTTSFKLVKKGYDPDEVDSFKEQVAAAVEHAQNQATAMEARARAAVAKLQEVSQQVGNAAPAPAAAPASSGDTEVISRTLLLAQRTADATVGEARAEADQIVNKARDEAGRVLDSARNMAAKTVDDARFEARRAAEDERVKADNEVQSLLARRDFLLSDVDHLEQYLGAQRERLRDAAVQLHELIERVPGGLGEMRRPLLSASAEPLPPELAPSPGGDLDTPSPKLHLDSLPAPRFADESSSTLSSSTPSFNSSDAVPAPPASAEDASERVWRMLDEEVASGRGAGTDVTGELTIPTGREAFRFEDEELQ
jgi:DivIVA domain-containing protein